MAPLSFFALAILVTTAQAAPAPHVTTTLLAAAFPNLPDGRPKLPLQTESLGTVTMTDTGGNVVACSSQVAFVVSHQTYLDCVGPQTTIASGSSQPPGRTLAVTTNSRGSIETLLPLVHSNATSLVPLLPTSATLSSSAFRITSPSGTTLLSFPPTFQSTGIVVSITANDTSARETDETSSSKNDVLGSSLPSSNNVSVAGGLTSSKSLIGKNGALTSDLSHGPVLTLKSYVQNSKSSAVSSWSSHSVIRTIPPFTSGSTQNKFSASPVLGQNSTSSAVTSSTQTTNSQSSSTSDLVVIGPSMGRMSSAPSGIPVGSETPMMKSSQPTPTTTETSLPTGASVQTLASGAYLSNQWITTTLAGSHSATVIPIVLPPGGGPPVALWGFVPGPPPSGERPTAPEIEIKIPNLACVRIFGRVIKGCAPSDKDPDPSPDPPSDPSPKVDKSPSASDSARDSVSRSASGTTIRSCSSATATITSVVCASSGTTSSCSTMKTSSVGCSASGYATTIGSCVASTTVGSSTRCCSSATVSSESTVCAFNTLTQMDFYMPSSQLQSSTGSMEQMSQFSRYMMTANASTSAVTSQDFSPSARPASTSASFSVSATSISRASKTTSKTASKTTSKTASKTAG